MSHKEIRRDVAWRVQPRRTIPARRGAHGRPCVGTIAVAGHKIDLIASKTAATVAPMPVAIIAYDCSLEGLLDENGYTLGRVEESPLSVAFVPDFEALHGEWMVTNATEITLRIDVSKASGRSRGCDGRFDRLGRRVQNRARTLADGAADHPLLKSLFHGQSLSTLTRPIFGKQLATMRGWNPTLETSSDPELAACGAELAALVVEADTLIKAQAAAEQALRDFRTIGPRKLLIDRTNAVRKRVHGKLAELPHLHPELNLPGDFADGFFKHEKRAKTEAEPTTRDEINAQIELLHAEIAGWNAKLVPIIATENALEAQRLEAEKLELDKAKQDAAALAAKIAALEAKTKEQGNPLFSSNVVVG